MSLQMTLDNSSNRNIEEDKDIRFTEITLEQNSQVTIFHLPYEIMLEILSYFDVVTLSQIICRVCKYWNTIANDPKLWIDISFTCYKTNVESYIPEVLYRCPYLKKLKIESGCIDNDLIVLISNRVSNIHSLSFKFCEIIIHDEKNICKLIKNCKYLKDVDLEGSTVSSRILHSFSESVSLKHLNLSHCVNLNNEALILIAENCIHLEFLNIDGITSIEDYSVEVLTRLRFSTLKKLFLDGECLTDKSYCSLEKCINIQYFSVSFSDQMTDKALGSIQKLSKLEYLKLRKANQLTAIGLANLFEDNKLHLLTHLNLGECSLLDDSTLKSISNSCPNLSFLSLPWCWEVTDDGLLNIVEKCTKLKVLDFIGLVRLKGDFIFILKDRLKYLRVLDLEQCSSIDDSILEYLATERPELRIFDYWGDLVKSGK